jgi:hypothetical protein
VVHIGENAPEQIDPQEADPVSDEADIIAVVFAKDDRV